MLTSEQTTLPCYLHRTPCRMGEGSTSGNPWGNSRKKGDLEKAGETNQRIRNTQAILIRIPRSCAAGSAARENRFCHFYSQKSACLMSMLSAILNDLEDELPP